MKLFILLLALFAAAIHAAILKWSPDSEVNLDYDIDQEWINFKETYGRTYESYDEEEKRFSIFKENLKKIRNHNRDYSNGLATYKQGVNEFSDTSFEEFNKIMSVKSIKGNRKTAKTVKPDKTFVNTLNPDELPKEVDWRKKGYVTPVKDQGKCGSCYAFSATGSLEGQLFKKTGKLVSLSEQNIMDCSEYSGNNGCHGGGVDKAFNYIELVGGINSEESYPYKMKKHFRCRFKQANIAAVITGYVQVGKNFSSLIEALATVGPISVGVKITKGFRDYKEGVLEDEQWEDGSIPVNHAVLAVGYGTENGNDYILVKNSWGPGYGDNGYIKIARKSISGITDEAYYPLV